MDLFSGSQTAYEGRAFRGLDLRGREIRAVEFDGCTFTGCSFLETAFTECRFVDCEFAGCDLSLCQVGACSFVNVRFADSQLVGINWTLASWPRHGLLRSIGFANCALNHSTFIGLSLREITVRDCIAHDVDFAEADLGRADCTGTDFADSRFLHTDLTEADFSGATNYAIAANLNVLKKAKFALPEAMSLLYSLDIILTE